LLKNPATSIAQSPQRAHNASGMAGLTLLKERVAEAVGEGADLEEVEARVIEHAPVEPEVRDALWLYAWTLLDRDDERPRRFQRSPRR
jgi:hypothetical protein